MVSDTQWMIRCGQHDVPFGAMCYGSDSRIISLPETASEYIELLRQSFPFFLQELWIASGLIRKWPLSFVELDMAAFYQKDSRRRVMLAPRNVGKTMPFTCGGTAWHLFRDPENTRSPVISKSREHANKVTRQVREWIGNVAFLRHLQPDPKTQRHSDKFFDVGPSGSGVHASIQSYGIDGQITGAHGNRLRFDDIETAKNTKTIGARRELKDITNEFVAIADNDGDTVGVGTPHHFDSIYVELHKRGYEIRSWPLWVPSDEESAENIGLSPLYGEAVARGLWKPGDLVFPHRYSLESIAEIRMSAPSFVAMQYQLRFLDMTSHFPFRVADLIVPDFQIDNDRAPMLIKWGETAGGTSTARDDIDCLGHGSDCVRRQMLVDTNGDNWVPYVSTVMTIDPAGKGLDRIGYCVASYLNGHLWVRKWGSIEGPVGPKQRDKLISMAAACNARTIIVESDFGQDAVVELLQSTVRDFATPKADGERSWSAVVESVHAPKYAKHERIVDALEGWIANHRVVVDPDAIRPTPDLNQEHEPQFQLAYIRREAGSIPHDDAIDALAMAATHFKEHLSVSPENMLEMVTERKRLAHLQEYLNHFRSEPEGQNPWWYRR